MATSSLTNTGNKPYTAARIDYLARYMQTQLPGLSYDAAVKWIRAEQGENGNVLGVTYRDASGQRLYQYQSQEAGIRAAVALIKSSGNYSGIRGSLGQDTASQLRAIAASPWNAPSHYNSGRTFGISIPKGTSGSPDAILAVAEGSGGSGTTLVWGIPDGKVLTSGDVQTILDAMQKANILPAPTDLPTTAAYNTVKAALAAEIGQPWATPTRQRIQTSILTTAGTDSAGAVLRQVAGSFPDIVPQQLKDAAAFVGDLGAAIFDPENWVYAAALVVGLPLALFGFYLLAGVQTGGANA